MKVIKGFVLCICILAVFATQPGVNAAEVGYGSITADLVDKDRAPGKIIIYTKNYGEYTKPFTQDTCEFVVVNNIVAYKNTDGTRGTYIPPSGYVISYTGSDTDFVKGIFVGMELTVANIYIQAQPDMYFELDGITIPIDGVNMARGANQVVLYNQSFGTSTKTNGWGMELTVINNYIIKVADVPSVKGVLIDNNSSIPTSGTVISIQSGNPYYKLLQSKVKVNSSISLHTDDVALYNASKTKYAAYNPRSIIENPLAWDTVNGRPYDGYRGPNQLVVYDSGYYGHTGTNAYGYEVTANWDGTIIGRGGNDLELPVGGYVLSGHGNKAKWLEKYAQLGARIILDRDKKEVTLIFSPDSYIDMARYYIKTANDAYDQAQKQYLDIAYGDIQNLLYSANAKLDNLQALVKQGQYKDLSAKVNEIRNDASNAYFMTFESVKVENRAVWLRPLKSDTVEIRKQIEMLKELNINTIYLETFWNGYAIYPTNNGVMPQNPIYNGVDVLEAYIKEAHSRGIELHVWVEDFLVNPDVAAKHPEWLIVSRKGNNYSLENGNTKYYFMNPALPEVRDFLSGLYKELVKKYDIDGIQFDYMRYPHSGDYTNDFSYDAYSRQLFISYTGTDPITLKPGDPLWQEWCDFRTENISSFAYRIISEVRSIKPGIQTSADVWPDYNKTLVDIYQDPKSWIARGYINNLIPMSYYHDVASVIRDVENTLAFTKGHSQVTAGIASYTGVDKNVFLRQVAAARAANTSGVSIFDYQSLFSGGYDSALKLGAFKAPALTTAKDPEKAVATVLKDITRKIDDIYTCYHAMDEQQAESYKKLIKGIKIDFADDYNIDKAEPLKQNIIGLLNTVNSDKSLNEEIAKRLGSDLNRAINIIDGYISDSRFIKEHKVCEYRVELSLETLRNQKEAPLKVKAIYNDGTAAYLDKTQFSINSDKPESVQVSGDRLKLYAEKAKAKITVFVMDTFKSAVIEGLGRKLEMNINLE